MQLYQLTITTYIGPEDVTSHHYVAAPDIRAAHAYAGTFTASLHGGAVPVDDDWHAFRTPGRRWKLDSVRPLPALTHIPGTDGRTYTFPVFALDGIHHVLAEAVRALENADWLLTPKQKPQSLFNNEIVQLHGALNGLGAPALPDRGLAACTSTRYTQAISAIRSGFQTWINEPARARSPEVDYGCWWTLKHPRDWPKWRVSLIVDTREVYAVALEGQRPDKFICLGQVAGAGDVRAEMEGLLRGWAESDMRLPDLLGRFDSIEPPPTVACAPVASLDDQADQRLARMFEALFTKMPAHKQAGGHLALSRCDGLAGGAWETDLAFRLGPDGQVWARVGRLDDIPDRTETD